MAHIDFCMNGGRDRVQRAFPDEFEALSKTHTARVVSAWRPLRTILKDPLAVMDAESLRSNVLQPYTLHLQEPTERTSLVVPRERHRWYYINEQTPQELLLIALYDSEAAGQPTTAPHASFFDEERMENDTRESIEVRLCLFWER